MINKEDIVPDIGTAKVLNPNVNPPDILEDKVKELEAQVNKYRKWFLDNGYTRLLIELEIDS